MFTTCLSKNILLPNLKVLVLVFFISLSHRISAQNEIPVGTWRTHLSYNYVIDIALGHPKIYNATSNAIFIIDKSDQSIQTITKLDGLSGGEISAIAYSESYSTLIIGYHDGNIDMIKDQEISNISTIKTDDFTPDKRINNIKVVDDRAYLSADFGISIIDLKTSNLRETIVNLGPAKILEATIHNDSVFAATSDGIISASLDPTINILDFNNWKLYSSPLAEIASITVAHDQLYSVEKQGNIYQYNDGVWSELPELQGESFIKLSPSKEGLFILTEDNVYNYVNGTLASVEVELITNANEVVQDNEGTIWVADQINGVIKTVNSNTSERVVPSGPLSEKAFHVEFIQNQMYVLSGEISDDSSPLNHDEGFYKFNNGRWESFNEAGVGIKTPQARDLNDITLNFGSNQVAIASFQDGILLINSDNSSAIINQSTA
jgi:hypothetical protein